MPFLLRFCAAIRDWELATIANRKKVAIRTDFLFLGSWEGPPRQCWDVMGSMRNGG